VNSEGFVGKCPECGSENCEQVDVDEYPLGIGRWTCLDCGHGFILIG